MNNQETAVATVSKNEIVESNSDIFKDQNFFTSIDVTNEANAVKLYNAVESCDILIKDVIGQQIKLKDVYIEKYVKEENGVQKLKFRTILFDEEGKSYVSTAYGIVNSLSKIMRIFGNPEKWASPKTVEFCERTLKDGRTSYMLKLVVEK